MGRSCLIIREDRHRRGVQVDQDALARRAGEPDGDRLSAADGRDPAGRPEVPFPWQDDEGPAGLGHLG